MNRRNFLRGLLVAGASFTVLPGAGRVWRAQRSPLDTLFDEIRRLKRIRQAQGGDGVIEVYCDARLAQRSFARSFFLGEPMPGGMQWTDLPAIEVHHGDQSLLGIREHLRLANLHGV